MIRFFKSVLFFGVLIFAISFSEAEDQQIFQKAKKKMKNVILLKDISWDELLGKPLDSNLFKSKGITLVTQFEPSSPNRNLREAKNFVLSSGEYLLKKDSKRYRVLFVIKELQGEVNQDEVVSYTLEKQIIK